MSRRLLVLVALLTAVRTFAGDQSSRETLAALDRVIMVRTSSDGQTYGRNEVDPLLWRGSTYFLEGESRERLRAALAAVVGMAEAEVQGCPPAQRALVQNRVWTVFDHLAAWREDPLGVDRELLAALAGAAAKLALAPEEIATLHDPLADAIASKRWPAEPAGEGGPDVFLPSELLDPKHGWEELTRRGGEPTAKHHMRAFGGRSLFSVHAKFPSDGPTPAAYFAAVAEFPTPWTIKAPASAERHSDIPVTAKLHPDLPVLPAGATLALVRRAAVVGRDGRWRATPLTLSVQLRRYHVTDRAAVEKRRAARGDGTAGDLQSFAEFVLETEAVAAGGAGRLRPIAPDEKRFGVLFAHDIDQVDGSGNRFPGFKAGPQDQPMQHCANCHALPGLGSVNSLFFFENTVPIARLAAAAGREEAAAVAAWKESRAEWGMMRLLWPTGRR